MKKILLSFLLFIFAYLNIAEDIDQYKQYGLPSTNIQLLVHTGYIIGYNSATKQADWTMHILTKQQMLAPRVKRSNDFRDDPLVQDGPTTEYYWNSGYDRGHMVPAGDVRYSKQSMSDCFYMTNMSPQKGELNQKKWNDMEIWIRDNVLKYNKFIIITGPIFDKSNTIKQLKGGVKIPYAYYKILYHPEQPQFMIAFIMPNKFCEKNLNQYVVSVDEVQQKTGLDFFNMLPNYLQEKYQSEINSHLVK